MKEMIKKYQKEIIKETYGQVSNPEKQAVVLTIETVRDFLRSEYEDYILDDYDFDERYEDWDEDYDTAVEKLWEEMDWGDLQESVSNYTFMDIYFVEIEGTTYCIGNIDEIEYNYEILDYAEWYNEDYANGEDEDEEVA